jgi:predicted ribosome quality control (RQC) complex YloA/Tae2 family protein
MRAARVMGSKGRGYRAHTIDGFEVLVGKGDAENDALTFRVGEPKDFWLHVAGPSGSHVVVRNPDGLEELPRAVLERAAALAAWYSKARGSRGKVEVHVCRVADVSKPRGFPPGQVLLRRWAALKVYPKPVEEAT